MIMLQCKLDIKFKLKSIVGVRNFVKYNLRVRNDNTKRLRTTGFDDCK